MKTSILSLVIRAFTVALRGTFFIYLARQLQLSEFGIFTLFYSTITIGVYLVGLDVYTFTSRELPGAPKQRANKLIQSQILTHAVGYLISFPVALIIFKSGFLPFKLLVWFVPILIFEHITQEYFRWFIALQHVLIANIVLTIRNSWLVLIFLIPDGVTVEFVLICWAVGTAISVLICTVIFIWYGYIQMHQPLFDINLIVKALKVSALYFISSFSLLATQHSARYFIKYFYNESLVGIYSFFWCTANLVNVGIYAAIVMIFLPKAIEHYNNNTGAFERQVNIMNSGIIYGTIAIVLMMCIGIIPLIRFTGKQELLGQINVYFILLISALILSISHVPYYVLYIKRLDKWLAIISVSGAGINILMNIVLIPRLELVGAALSVLTSVIVIALLRLWASKRVFFYNVRAMLFPNDIVILLRRLV